MLHCNQNEKIDQILALVTTGMGSPSPVAASAMATKNSTKAQSNAGS